MAEKVNSDFEMWFKKHVSYLPGDSWPEAWLIQKSKVILEPLSNTIGSDTDSLKDFLEYSLQAGKHYEFHELARQTGLERNHCMQIVTSQVSMNFQEELSAIIGKVEELLNC